MSYRFAEASERLDQATKRLNQAFQSYLDARRDTLLDDPTLIEIEENLEELFNNYESQIAN